MLIQKWDEVTGRRILVCRHCEKAGADGVERFRSGGHVCFIDDTTCPDCSATSVECGDHGWHEPTCDHCGQGQCFTPGMAWNGDTGCHVECERKLVTA